MFRIVRILFLALSLPLGVFGQTGERLFPFLELPVSVVAAGNGGQVVSSPAPDINLVYHNPALLGPSLTGQVAFGYMNYLADINTAFASYCRGIDDKSRWMAGIRFVDYGTMPWTSETNELLGETSGHDMVATGAYAWKLSTSWRAGASVNLINSVLDVYTSTAMGVDLGVYYENPDGLFTAGMSLVNLGSQLTAYDETYEPLPWDIRLGVSKKLAHAPFRFNVTARNLSQRSFNYMGGAGLNNLNVAEQLFCRLVGGIDFLPSDQVQFSLGYNYRRVRELSIDQRTFFGGFSAGMLLRIKQMTVGASYATYHAGGNSLLMTLSFNTSVFGIQ